ncbi:MAG: cupin-like domain-containing protein [Pseudomonadales bacterium]
MTDITKKVDVLEACTPNNIPPEVFSSTKPLLLKGLVKDWPLVKDGMSSNHRAIETLRSFYSGKAAPVYYGDAETQGRLSYKPDVSALNFEIRRASIEDVLDEILDHINDAAPPVRYIASNIIDIFFPGLSVDNGLSLNGGFFEENPLEKGDPMVGIWIGNKTTSPCHYDAQSNIACCAVGKRKFTLFPPDQIQNLYPGPLDLTPGGQAITMVDFSAPDLEKYPRFEEAMSVGQVAELEAGDAIYIPCMWWHQVEATSEFNVLINYWWNTFPQVNGQAMNVLNHALLSLRDRPSAEKEAWRHIFNYYIFGDAQLAGEHLPEQARGILEKLDDAQARQLRAQLINKLNR